MCIAARRAIAATSGLPMAADDLVADLGDARLQHFHVAKDRLAGRQRGPATLDRLRMNAERAGQREIGRRMDDPLDDPPAGGVPCRGGVRSAGRVELPGDDLAAPQFDFLSQRRQRHGGRGHGRQPLDHQVLQGRVVLQRRQDLQHDRRELPAALLDQGGNVVRHVLARVEKIGQKHDPPHAARSQLGHPIGNVRPGNGKERGQDVLRASRAAIRPTSARNRSLASARGLP